MCERLPDGANDGGVGGQHLGPRVPVIHDVVTKDVIRAARRRRQDVLLSDGVPNADDIWVLELVKLVRQDEREVPYPAEP